MRTRREQSPGDPLAEIAAIYSHLSPLFAMFRADPHLAGHTLLPSALSPLAPAMAWGHCGSLPHGEARKKLDAHPEWQASAGRLEELYQGYKSQSGNALLWAGWNHWDPGTPEEPLLGRVIQVVLTSDLAGRADLFSADRQLLGRGQNAIWGRNLLQVPEGCPADEVPLGGKASGDATLLSQEFIQPRLFLFNLWQSLFVPSASAFLHAGVPTIVDYVKQEHLRYLSRGSGEGQAPIRDLEVLFSTTAEGTEGDQLEGELTRSFVCQPKWATVLWEAVEHELLNPVDAALAATQDPLQRLQRAWQNLADRPPANLEPAWLELSRALGSPLTPGAAYAILQHLALFPRVLDSSCQYVLPVAFGRHLFVAFLAMRQRLSRPELLGWRQIVSTLFGSLIVERVSDLAYMRQLDERQSELRRVLSHAMPKAVFQPAQYFAGKMLMAIQDLPDRAVSLGDAQALLFLLAKGQSDLATLAVDSEPAANQPAQGLGRAPVSVAEMDTPLDVFAACDSLKKHFDAIKEFLLAGQMDRVGREQVLENLGFEVLPTQNRPQVLVRMNRSVLFFHLWNLVDNAFRHGGLVGRARETASNVQIGLEVVGDSAKLSFRNAGSPIAQDRADQLNELLSVHPARLPTTISRGIAKRGTSFPENEMEDDHEGQGLARLSLYLASLWKRAERPDKLRGKVTPLVEGTLMEFYLPCEPNL